MKKLFQKALVRLNKQELNELTKMVKETISHEQPVQENKKRFTSAEMWRIHSMKRPVTIRRGFTL